MVPAPVERSELPGHRQRSQIPQHRQYQRQHCPLPSRAREAGANSSALGGRPTCTGRLGGAAAAGRPRHFFFAELLLAASGADDGARAIGADADVGFAWSGRRRWCRRRSSAASYRVIANDRKFRSTDSSGALPRSLSAAEQRLGKISGIWQRQHCPLPSRAREAGADSSALGGRPTCTGRLGGAAAAGRPRHFFFAELLLAASGADDGARAIGADADVGFAWSGRRRWCRRRSSAASYRIIANDRKFRSTDSSGALPRSLSAAEQRLGKISGIGSVNTVRCPHARARPAPIPARSEADRPAPAGSAALRLLADLDISFSRNCCWQLRGRTMALGRSAPMLTSASPGRGGGDGAGAGRAQRATGSSPTIANSAAPTVVALSLARSAPRSSGSERSAEFGSVNTVRCPHARARPAPIPARSEADRPAPAGSAALRLLADLDISFSRNCCWQLRGRTMALGRSAPMLTSASPGRGGGDGAGAGRAQRATGSSPTIANSAAPTVVQR